MMKIKKWISLLLLIILLILGLHFLIKGYGDEYAFIAVTLMIGLPIFIALIVSIFKKSLFHPVFWSFAVLMLGFIGYLRLSPRDFDSDYLKEIYIVQNHFESKAGFFTPFSLIIIFNQDIDSAEHSKEVIIKCLYRMGSKKIDNFYIGKIKLENGNVIKEYYNQRIFDNPILAEKEFGERLREINELRPMLDTLIKK